jgi:hypothetical protein
MATETKVFTSGIVDVDYWIFVDAILAFSDYFYNTICKIDVSD